MEYTIDNCQQYIINILREGIKKHCINSTSLSLAAYDISLNHCVGTFMNTLRISDPNNPLTKCHNYEERQRYQQIKADLENLFSETLWELTRRGIVRPGERHGGNFSVSQVRALDEGFTVTEYGREWLNAHQKNDILPLSRGCLEELYSKFQQIYGKDYFRRAKEAVSCYFSGNYLACCVMCGAATESILLAAAYVKNDKNKVLKLYKTARGRNRLENSLFGKKSQYIQERYSKYTDLINYWCDESGHGDESDIDVHEAYLAMLTLLRCAEFIEDHWMEITT